jgi:hypothetical protein
MNVGGGKVRVAISPLTSEHLLRQSELPDTPSVRFLCERLFVGFPLTRLVVGGW